MADDPAVIAFINSFSALKALQKEIIPESEFTREDERYHLRGKELQKREELSLRTVTETDPTDKAFDETVIAYKAARLAQSALERERAHTLIHRGEIVNNNRRIEEKKKGQVRACVKKLISLDEAFREAIAAAWANEGETPEANLMTDDDTMIEDANPTQTEARTEAAVDTEETRNPGPTSPATQDQPADNLEDEADPFEDDAVVIELERRSQRARSATMVVERRGEPASAASASGNVASLGEAPCEAAEYREDTIAPSGNEPSRDKGKRRWASLWTEDEPGEESLRPEKPNKRRRRTQIEMGKEDPLRKQVRNNILVAKKTIGMSELSLPGQRHFINERGRGRFFIYKCDVCGVHFDTLNGALTHLTRAPQHFSLRKALGLGDGEVPATKKAARHTMEVSVTGCSQQEMQRHNAELQRDRDRGAYTRRNALATYSAVFGLCYNPERPTILLPRHQEKNCPPWQPQSAGDAGTAGSGSSHGNPGGLPVQSDIPQPKKEKKIHGFTPGQVYWVKDEGDQKYRVALALPYRNMKDIGLPDFDVSNHFARMLIKRTYDAETGYVMNHTNGRGLGGGDQVSPMLYLDYREGKAGLEVAFPRITSVREFERADIAEGDPAFVRLYQYLDEDKLWFMNEEPHRSADKGVDRDVTPPVVQPIPLPERIEISDDEDNGIDDDDLPDAATLISRTPPKPSTRSKSTDRTRLSRRVKPLGPPWVMANSDGDNEGTEHESNGTVFRAADAVMAI